MQKHQVLALFLLLFLVSAANILSWDLIEDIKPGLTLSQASIAMFFIQPMKYISQLRKKRISFLLVLSLLFFVLSCKKNTSIPKEGVPAVSVTKAFSLLKVDYLLEKTDGEDSTIHQLKSYKLSNSSNDQIQQTYIEDFQYLNKKSFFTFDSLPVDLAKYIDLSTVYIQTPAEIDAQRIYAFDLGWQLSATLQQRPVNEIKPSSQAIKIPARSLIQIDRSITEYWAKVSFSAVFKNESTGQLCTVRGKWRGTLYFSNYSVVLSEQTLK
ncbi:hypothetical protein [Pedobacter sp. V48]|uniref:hypothetical protein n=1 Tax=Pedobacter sp. V48 TaxID=509635 RepID=UPI0003E4FF5F|nr:hypothetical protein [Pedobacter sp. V48]ETZ23878.1 hypothetical protein N824_15180 [Pedobacter sp. V48]